MFFDLAELGLPDEITVDGTKALDGSGLPTNKYRMRLANLLKKNR
jgi:hypothetical protein